MGKAVHDAGKTFLGNLEATALELSPGEFEQPSATGEKTAQEMFG
jgi:hypothetical protein